jgi:sugar (pentulose or hexulose) kinase
MAPILLCLDSGTTAVKAAAFDRDGRLVALAQRPNSALRRHGERVEQDMEASRDDALAVLADCVSRAEGKAEGLIVTGQGDGLWPLDAGLRPVGRAMTPRACSCCGWHATSRSVWNASRARCG